MSDHWITDNGYIKTSAKSTIFTTTTFVLKILIFAITLDKAMSHSGVCLGLKKDIGSICQTLDLTKSSQICNCYSFPLTCGLSAVNG